MPSDGPTDDIPRADGGSTPGEILATNREHGPTVDATDAPAENRSDSSTPAGRQAVREYCDAYLDDVGDTTIVTAKGIKNALETDVSESDIGKALGCRRVGETRPGYLTDIEVGTWGDANTTTWVLERTAAEPTPTEIERPHRKPDLVAAIDAELPDDVDYTEWDGSDGTTRVRPTKEWKRATVLAVAEADADRTLSEADVRPLTKRMSSIALYWLLDVEPLGDVKTWNMHQLRAVFDVLVSGVDPAEVRDT